MGSSGAVCARDGDVPSCLGRCALGVDQTGNGDGEADVGNPEEVKEVASFLLVRTSEGQEKGDDGDFGKGDAEDGNACCGPEVLEGYIEIGQIEQPDVLTDTVLACNGQENEGGKSEGLSFVS